MRPVASPAPSSSFTRSSLLEWNSPLPYVFGGLVFILGLLAVAMIILACSHYKAIILWKLSTDNQREEKTIETSDIAALAEPKIVVIMAGDDHPTYVAKPSTPSCHAQQQEA